MDAALLLLRIVAGIASAMLTATFSVHLGKGWFSGKGGPELPLTNLAVAVAVLLVGPGRWSLDAALGLSYPSPQTQLAVAILVVAGVAFLFATRRAAPPPPAG